MTASALVPAPTPEGGWRASLDLAFDATALGTRLVSRRHTGPLVVQRALYPEGPAVCHAIIVHPPGGIAGGDDLRIDVAASDGAHALLTTPGATKVYKSGGKGAAQSVGLRVARNACVEWLPQETIVFDGADVRLTLDIELDGDARVVAWEIVTLGREAMGEHFRAGCLRTQLEVRRNAKPLLHEVGRVAGASTWLDSPVGWRGARACGTLVVAGLAIDDTMLQTCRAALAAWEGRAALSRPAPELVVARYLGPSASQAREVFVALWRCLREAVSGRPALPPRIWST